MLYINPHIPLDEPYEINLRSDAGLNVSGMVAYGAGVLPRCGFNDHLGWALTVNYPDIADTYAVKFDVPGSPLAYRYGDSLRYAVKWTEKIKVREGDQISEREITCAKCVHGPLLYTVKDTSYAIRLPRIERLGAFAQWYHMAKAENVDAWKSAVGTLGLVFHNLVYADKAGNIGYIYNAALPVRDPAFNWTGTLDGNDPRTEWKGYHPLSALPQVWNPPSGYVASCNSSPFSVTADGENADPAKYPKDMIGADTGDARVVMSHDLLSKGSAWTLDDLQRAAFNTRVYAVDTIRPQLLADFEAFSARAQHVDERLPQALQTIRDWNGTLEEGSEASTLFMLWIDKIFAPAWKARRKPGDLTLAMLEVIADLERDFGSWRVKWGADNRLQRFDSHAGLGVSDARESLPVAGGHGSVGVSFCFLARPEQTKLRYGYHGNSYVAAVEFGAVPAARTIVPFGASRNPDSPHFADQMPLYARGEMRPRTVPARTRGK
jgi:acyl-homoserine lactone acylase PvdQ